MYYLYILKSIKEGQIYIGSTNNIERRLKEHNRGHTISTRRFIPWRVLYLEKYLTKKEAVRREQQLKKWKSRKRIDTLISRTFSR